MSKKRGTAFKNRLSQAGGRSIRGKRDRGVQLCDKRVSENKEKKTRPQKPEKSSK